MSSVEAVIFDIGMVLVEWHPEDFYDREIGEDRRRAMFQACDLHEMNKAIDLGVHSRTVAYGHAAKHPEWADEIRLWHDRWIEMVTPEVPHSAKLLRALRSKGVLVYALSNFGANTFDQAKEAYPILKEFDRQFVSGHLGVIKPDRRIYEIVEVATGHAPENLLFVDDMPANVAAAAARGWRTHQFDGPQGWAQRLVSEGLLTEAESAA